MFKGNNKFITLFIVFGLWTFIIIGIYLVPKFPFAQKYMAEYPSNIETITPNHIWGQTEAFDFEEIPVEEPYLISDGNLTEEELNETSSETEFKHFTHKQFLELFDDFEQDQEWLTFSKPFIYNNEDVDTYIKNFAEVRGYKIRGVAPLEKRVNFENVITIPEVRDAYVSMRNEMKKDGAGNLHFVSGFRSPDRQRTIFTNKMAGVVVADIPNGNYDTLLNTVLDTSSIPGYSKHHTGYAADFGCGNDALVYEFAHTSCYRWLSENNFENAKRFGFIPSYPEGVESQGPLPEPWEFVWVGIERLLK